MPVFEKLHQNKGLTALNITSNKFLFARAHQIWSMTPRWSQKTHGLLEAVLLVSSCRCDTTHGYGMVYIYICMYVRVCMYVHIYMHATILLYIYIYRYSTLQQNEYHMFKKMHHNTTSVFTGWQLDYDPWPQVGKLSNPGSSSAFS